MASSYTYVALCVLLVELYLEMTCFFGTKYVLNGTFVQKSVSDGVICTTNTAMVLVGLFKITLTVGEDTVRNKITVNLGLNFPAWHFHECVCEPKINDWKSR
ncbi:hypothetical protein XENOCAPTIV_011430 [Xenoophorus captivus]|uniref:Uncharacterized protein n=1 Tax=Xenoophorus captivus TaxID=1517983 RepID=A0ABV0QD31_9TELE